MGTEYNKLRGLNTVTYSLSSECREAWAPRTSKAGFWWALSLACRRSPPHQVFTRQRQETSFPLSLFCSQWHESHLSLIISQWPLLQTPLCWSPGLRLGSGRGVWHSSAHRFSLSKPYILALSHFHSNSIGLAACWDFTKWTHRQQRTYEPQNYTA